MTAENEQKLLEDACDLKLLDLDNNGTDLAVLLSNINKTSPPGI